jgi:soluble lytic murein transglycosylase-like protein
MMPFAGRWGAALLIWSLAAVAAFSQAQGYNSSLRAMETSLAKQRESVRLQVQAESKGTSEGWFTTAWPIDAALQAANADASLAGDCDPIPAIELQAHIEETAKREGFTPDLLRAVIDRESAFRPCAVSDKGAQGLMQLMPGTAADLGVRDPFDAKENISGGAKFLRQMLTRYGGDIGRALAAYNAGPGRVDSYEGLPPIPETVDYVSDIMDKLRLEPLPSPKSF